MVRASSPHWGQGRRARTAEQYTQTSGSYRATYKLREVAPGRFVGTLTDSTGTFNVELTEVR